jgi:hypothetical protein
VDAAGDADGAGPGAAERQTGERDIAIVIRSSTVPTETARLLEAWKAVRAKMGACSRNSSRSSGAGTARPSGSHDPPHPG